jgi:hypothetical protein
MEAPAPASQCATEPPCSSPRSFDVALLLHPGSFNVAGPLSSKLPRRAATSPWKHERRATRLTPRRRASPPLWEASTSHCSSPHRELQAMLWLLLESLDLTLPHGQLRLPLFCEALSLLLLDTSTQYAPQQHALFLDSSSCASVAQLMCLGSTLWSHTAAHVPQQHAVFVDSSSCAQQHSSCASAARSALIQQLMCLSSKLCS